MWGPGRNATAVQRVIGHLYTFSRSNCDSEANGGPSVVEVLRSPPRESIRPRSVDSESLDPGNSAAVGEEVDCEFVFNGFTRATFYVLSIRIVKLTEASSQRRVDRRSRPIPRPSAPLTS